MAKITAPVEGFNGDVAGVQFTDSVAETDNAAVISYCAGAGYKVEVDELPEPEGPEREPQPPVDNAHIAPGSELFPPNGNASKAEWLAYALQNGFTEEGLEGRSRDEIRALINEE